MNNLDYDSIVPLYEQIKRLVNQDILNGNLKPKQRIPTEVELSSQYGVSIVTVRRAIQALVDEGYIEKRQGKGTFIAAPSYQKSFANKVMSFSETCEANGLRPGAKVLALDMRIPDTHISNFLQLPKNTAAVHILRLRYADNIPRVIEENYFPPQFQYLLKEDLEDTSLYRLLREKYNTQILPGRLTLKAVRADRKTAACLNIELNAPLLKMLGYNVQTSGEPLHSCAQIGYGEDFEIVIR